MSSIEALAKLVTSAEIITILTGAGVSAESGIPTFRDAQTGLWAQYDAEELATPEAFKRNPKLVWEWYAWRRQLVAEKTPNPGHHALAALEKRIPFFTLITQNVDGFHQLAGSENVIELHGNIQRCHCIACGVSAETWNDDAPPACSACGNHLRPSVVWFGEGLDPSHLQRAATAAADAHIFFSIGTASMVYPAAQLPLLALENGATLVEVNPNRTPLTMYADFHFSAESGTFLPALLNALD